MLSALDQAWTAEALLAVAGTEDLAFDPGTAFAYSNSNYLVAGLAIEAITGSGWAVEVRRRLVDPLGLSDTHFPSIGAIEPIGGYIGAPGQWVDVSDTTDPSVAGASGEIVATAADVATFARALFSGTLVPEGVLAAMTTEQILSDGTSTGYGLGVMLDPPYLGHSGSTAGFQSRLAVDGSGRVVVSLVNSFTAEADLVDRAVWEVLP